MVRTYKVGDKIKRISDNSDAAVLGAYVTPDEIAARVKALLDGRSDSDDPDNCDVVSRAAPHAYLDY